MKTKYEIQIAMAELVTANAPLEFRVTEADGWRSVAVDSDGMATTVDYFGSTNVMPVESLPILDLAYLIKEIN